MKFNCTSDPLVFSTVRAKNDAFILSFSFLLVQIRDVLSDFMTQMFQHHKLI